MARRRDWSLHDVMWFGGAVASLAVLWQLNHPAPPKPKTFNLHVGGSPNVPFVLEVVGPGLGERRQLGGVIPKDFTFPAKGQELLIVHASRPKEAPFGVIELTLIKDGHVISTGETKPPQNLATVQGT